MLLRVRGLNVIEGPGSPPGSYKRCLFMVDLYWPVDVLNCMG